MSDELQRLAPAVSAILKEHPGDVKFHDLYDSAGAEIYEAVGHEDFQEIPELVSLIRRTEGPILELASGSGRLTLPFLSLGREVTAVDNSAPMLALLQSKVLKRYARFSERLTVSLSDMETYKATRLFDTVVLGCISISLLDSDQRQKLFSGAKDWLAPHGRFFLSTSASLASGNLELQPLTPHQSFSGFDGRGYKLHQVIDIEASLRHVFVLPAYTPPSATLKVFHTKVRILSPQLLTEEMARNGLTVISTHSVKVADGGDPIVILEAVWNA